MHFGQKISGVELAFLSAWQCGYSVSYTLWRTDVKEYKSRHMVLLIFTPQVYANFRPWPEELLAQVRREFYTDCTLVSVCVCPILNCCISIVQVLKSYLHLLAIDRVSTFYRAKVIITDLEQFVPLMQMNITQNANKLKDERVQACALKW